MKPVPLVHCSALVELLQLGIANAEGLALDPVTFATTVFAACAARLGSVTSPVAVNPPVIVGFEIVGAVPRTIEPVPVDVVVPVPPLDTESGVCNVKLLNVGEG